MKAKTIKLAGYQIRIKPLIGEKLDKQRCSVYITKPKESTPYVGFISNIENAEVEALNRLVHDISTNFKAQQTI